MIKGILARREEKNKIVYKICFSSFIYNLDYWKL